MQTITLEIEQLEELSTTAHIEKALESVSHVSSVRVEPGRATVEHDGAASREELLDALRVLGYDRVAIH